MQAPGGIMLRKFSSLIATVLFVLCSGWLHVNAHLQNRAGFKFSRCPERCREACSCLNSRKFRGLDILSWWAGTMTALFHPAYPTNLYMKSLTKHVLIVNVLHCIDACLRFSEFVPWIFLVSGTRAFQCRLGHEDADLGCVKL